MTRYLVTRCLSVLPVLFGVSIVAFLMVHLIPGDAAQVLAGPFATGEDIARLREAMGLNQPLHVQYLTWAARVVRGDLGNSLEIRQPVAAVVADKFGNTVILATASMLFALLIGLPAGILSATRRGSWIDRATMVLALLGNSMPAFWLGLVLLLVFAFWLRWLPSAGMFDPREGGDLADLLRHLIMPAVTLGTVSTAIIARMTRASMLEVIGLDYVKTARAKGLTEPTVVLRHALKNALLPVITVVALQFGFLLGGAVIVETVFSWPGLGFQLFRAIANRDLPLIQGAVLLVATMFVIINLLVDLLYAAIDPRVRYGT